VFDFANSRLALADVCSAGALSLYYGSTPEIHSAIHGSLLTLSKSILEEEVFTYFVHGLTFLSCSDSSQTIIKLQKDLFTIMIVYVALLLTKYFILCNLKFRMNVCLWN
jgi:hypothetical protein